MSLHVKVVKGWKPYDSKTPSNSHSWNVSGHFFHHLVSLAKYNNYNYYAHACMGGACIGKVTTTLNLASCTVLLYLVAGVDRIRLHYGSVSWK